MLWQVAQEYINMYVCVCVCVLKKAWQSFRQLRSGQLYKHVRLRCQGQRFEALLVEFHSVSLCQVNLAHLNSQWWKAS